MGYKNKDPTKNRGQHPYWIEADEQPMKGTTGICEIETELYRIDKEERKRSLK